MSDQLERDIRDIKYRVDGIDKSVDLLLRASRKEITNDLLDFFGKSSERVKVFLAIDGERTVGDNKEGQTNYSDSCFEKNNRIVG